MNIATDFNPASITCQICLGVLMRIMSTQKPVRQLVMKTTLLQAARKEPEFSSLINLGPGMANVKAVGFLAGIPAFVDDNLSTDLELV